MARIKGDGSGRPCWMACELRNGKQVRQRGFRAAHVGCVICNVPKANKVVRRAWVEKREDVSG